MEYCFDQSTENTSPVGPDADIFQSAARRITLAQVLDSAEHKLVGSVLRDTRSAFAALVRAGIDLSTIDATPSDLRALWDSSSLAGLGLSEKRLANIRSCVIKAAEKFGQPRIWITREIALSPEWEELFSRIPQPEYRWALSRLGCFCTVKGIHPDLVRVSTLHDFYAALDAELTIKKPRGLLKHTIAVWNMCLQKVPGWPATKLSSPFKAAPAMLPLEALPLSFQADVQRWEKRMRNPDPLDPEAPVRALREPTLQSYRFTVRRIASALVRAGALTIDEVTSFAIFFEADHFREGIRAYLPPKHSNRNSDYAHKMATQLIVIARTHVGLDEGRIKQLKAVAHRIKSKGGRVMGERNRRRLDQFDDIAIVQRLLRFPEEELARALTQKSRIRQAKGVERALAFSLGIFTGLRVKNLRSLHLKQNIRRSGDRVFIHIPEEQAKTYRSLDLELPLETIELLNRFLHDHRTVLPGSDGPYLFPGEEDGPRSYSGMRDALGRALSKHTGITFSPHLFRHFAAKLTVERNPELIFDISRRLGHTSVSTTLSSYLGSEGPAASRRINDLLQGVRDSERAAK